LAGRLRHANILAPESARRHADGSVELWMELAEGGSLGDVIKRAKYTRANDVAATRLGEAAARALFLGVADGVSYLHSRNVCHRDIKVGNVVLDAAGSPRLVDFGCAKWDGGCEVPRGAAVPGTVAYMPPETLRGDAHDGRGADVWALGVLLYNLLERGEYPFGQEARDEAELKGQICSQPPALPAHLSPSCRDLLAKLLEKDPARRLRAADVRTHPWAAAAGPAPKQPLVERAAAPPVVKHGGRLAGK
jgi:5'-AMP-activated protein kinase catalytic alpha subunit